MLDQLNIYSECFSRHRTHGFDNIDRLLFQYYILRSYSKWASTHKQQSIDLVPHWIRAWCWTQYEWKIHREKNKWKDGQRVKEEQESGQKALGERERENLQKLLQISTRITALGNLLWPSPPLSFHSLEIGF